MTTPDKITKAPTKRRFTTRQLKHMTLFGYFGLLIFMPLWFVVLAPTEGMSATTNLVLFVAPLLLPAKGLITGKPYTYAWANFIVMIYLTHGLTSLWVSDGERLYALIELFFAVTMFIAGSYYAKYRGQELGLRIKKFKQELKEEKEQHEQQS